MRSSIFPLTVISYIAIVVVADDLFSDFTVTDSNLDAINWDNTPDLSNNLLPNGADTSGQLLAFNDNQDSNPSADVNQFSTDGLFGQSANLIQDNSISLTDSASTNQASTSFLDDGTLDTLVGANPASSNLFDEFDPNGQLPSSDLLAGGTASSCSSFQPSSPSKRRRKRGDLVPREGGEACAINRLQVPKGFIGSSSAAQSKVYNAYVCPTTDFPDALVPVCSSIVVTNNVYILGSAPIFPDSHTLFDSSLRKSFPRQFVRR